MKEEPMPGPGSARPDLCAIHAAAEQNELAEAVRSGISAAGYPHCTMMTRPYP